MPNELVSYFRSRFPDSPKSDDEITIDFFEKHGPEALKDYPEAIADFRRILIEGKKASRSVLSELPRGVAGGVQQLQAAGYGTAALGADIVGAEAAKQAALEGYKRNIQEAADVGPTIGSIEDIKGLEDAARWALGTIGSQVPVIGTLLAGGGAGALLGRAGAAAGMAAATFPQVQNYGALATQEGGDPSRAVPTALTVGAASTAMEMLPVMRFLGKMFPARFGAAAAEVAEKILPRIVREVPAQALLEGGTEVAQEITAIAGEAYANPNLQISPEEIRSRVLNAASAGGLVGGLMGGLEAIPNPRRNAQQTPPQQAAVQTAPIPASSPAQPLAESAPPQAAAPAYPSPLRSPLSVQEDPLDEYVRRQREAILAIATGAEEAAARQQAAMPRVSAVEGQNLMAAAEVNPLIQGLLPGQPGPAAPAAVEAPIERSDQLEKANEKGRQEGLLNNPQLLEPIDNDPVRLGANSASNFTEGQAGASEANRQINVPIAGLDSSVGSQASRSKSPPDLAITDADLLRNFPPGNAVGVKPDGKIDIPTYSRVLQGVLGAIQDGEIFRRVITSIPVDVVNLLAGNKFSPESLLRDKTMFIDALSTSGNLGVQALAVDSIVRSPAFPIAEVFNKDSRGATDDRRPALATINHLGNVSGGTQTVQPIPDAMLPAEATTNPFDIDRVDWDNSALTAAQTKRGTSEGRASEAAFFIVDDLAYNKELADKLTSDAKATQSAKSNTRRVTFFEDSVTSEVIGLPTYYTSPKGGKVVYVTDPFKKTLAGKPAARNTTLEQFMADGRFTPVASVRMTDEISATDRSNVWRYADYKDFENRFAAPGLAKLQNLARYAREMPAKMAATTENEEGETFEFAPEDAPEKDYAQEFADILIEGMAKARQQKKDITLDEIAKIIVEAGADDETSGPVLEAMRFLLQDPAVRSEVESLAPEAAQMALTLRLAERIYDRVRQFAEDPSNLSAGVESLANGGGLLESRPDKARQAAGAGRATKGQIQARFNALLEAAQDAGVQTNIVQAVGDEIGSYSGKERKITLSLSDAQNPTWENLRLLLHEFAHDILRNAPIEIQEAARNAINAYSDEQLGIEQSEDPRIAQSNPAGLTPQILSEERLAEALALQGLNQPSSQSIASQIVRALKALYYRLAMAVQKVFGRDPSPTLAMAYVRNRFGQRTANGRIDSLFRFVIPPAGAYFEEDLLSTPQGMNKLGERVDDARVVIQANIAALNEQIELEKAVESELRAIPMVMDKAKAANQDPMAWFRAQLRLPDARAKIVAEQGRVNPVTRIAIGGDENGRISDLQSEGNRALAYREALANLRGQLSKITRYANSQDEKIKKLEARKERNSLKYQEAAKESSLPMSPEDQARRQAALKKIQDQGLDLKEEIESLTAKRDAARRVSGLYAAKINELSGPLKLHAPFFVAHNAKVQVPEADGKWSTLTLKLDSSTGELTKKFEIQSAVRKMTEWLQQRSEAGSEDGQYHSILRQRDELLRVQWATDRRSIDHTATMLAMSSAPSQMKAVGTPVFRLIAQMMNVFTGKAKFIHAQLRQMAFEVERARSAVADFANMDPDYYRSNYYEYAAAFMKRARDLAEKFPSQYEAAMGEAMRKLREDMMKDPVLRERIEGREDRFFELLRRDWEANWKVAKWLAEQNPKAGVFVQDDRLGGERDYINHGIGMIPQRISDTMRGFWGAMAEKWAEARHLIGGNEDTGMPSVADTYGTDAWQDKAAEINGLFSIPDAWHGFLRDMVTQSPIFSLFKAHPLEDGTPMEANPAHVSKAFDQSEPGDVIGFLERLSLMEGKEPTPEFMQANLQVLADTFGQVHAIMEQSNPTNFDVPKTWKNLVPSFMVHSLQIDHLPAGWFEHVTFDQNTVNRITERVAAQMAFGRNQQRLEAAVKTAASEFSGAIRTLKNAEQWVVDNVPDRDRKTREAALADRVGGKEELKRLQRLASYQKILRQFESQMIQYFNGKHATNKTLTWIRQMTSTLVTLMLNQPGSAIAQLSDVFTPFLEHGASPGSIAKVARNMKETFLDLGGGLLRAFGASVQRSDEEWRLAQELGIVDPESERRLRDVMNEPRSVLAEESRMAGGLRRLRETVTTSARAGGGFTGFRPFAPFQTAALAVHASGVVNTWKAVKTSVLKGVEWVRDNPAAFTPEMADYTLGQWADTLGLTGGAKSDFKRLFQLALDDWGLDYFSLVDEALSAIPRGAYPLSETTLERLQGMYVQQAVSESNIATMNLSAFTNSVLQLMLSFLGWPIRRAGQILKLGRDEKGLIAHEALVRNLGGLFLLTVGGLGISMLVDLYNEEVLRKRRNLRTLSPDQDMRSLALAVLEHSARVGTGGLFLDLANELVNVGTGEGANRGLSFDGRIMFANSLMGMMRSVASFVNQDFEADYANVIRPLMFSVGGNGALQYLQMMNTAFDLDNAEARAVSRTNVSNWLRVVGRQLDMEVRKSSGGYNTPTPMTPHITRMQLAALADDPAGFNRAYREAVAEARKEKKEAPEKYVADAFSTRHPLRAVFRQAPSEADYRRILSALPEGGRADVREAIDLFNRYGARLGVRPFDGKEPKIAGQQQNRILNPITLNRLLEVRQRAGLF